MSSWQKNNKDAMPDIKITDLIPHRPPMVMIDRYQKISQTAGTSVKQFSREDYGCEGGQVMPVVLIECVAQTVAAQHGYDRLTGQGGGPAMGMLVSVDHVEFFAPVPGDARVTINVEKTDEIGPFHLIQGEIICGDSLMAKGKIKIFNQEKTGEAG